jgi:methionyl aminopeptidase
LIIIKSKQEIKKMEKVGRIVGIILKRLQEKIKPGMSTLDINFLAEKYLEEFNARPAFKGYRGFPKSICVSINEEVVHGIPKKDKIIKEGDIVSLDFGAEKYGFFADSAITICVGEITKEKEDLINTTKKALYLGIEKAISGNFVGDISYAIQSYVESKGYSVVKELVGHGIGKMMHEEPQIPNFGYPKTGPLLNSGMTLAIEPMVNQGTSEIVVDADGWTVKTKDGKLSSHFEHTILIDGENPKILTEIN